jgi:hypothetical protein
MLRVPTSLILIAEQALLAAPLYVCSSAGGQVRIDSGPAACIGCPSNHLKDQDHGGCCSKDRTDNSPAEGFRGISPCDCRHQPLCDGMQYVQRHEIVVAGLLAAGISQFAPERPARIHVAVLDLIAGSAHTSLADQASIRLRC